MAKFEQLETHFTANIVQFDKELKRMQTLNARAARKIEQDQARSAQGVSKAWKDADLSAQINKTTGSVNSMTAALTRLAPALAAAFSAREALAAADTYTRFSNALAVTGLEGEQLAKVQDHLFETAKRAGLGVEALGQLYGRTASAARDLGLSQGQTLQLTDTVSNALKVQGSTAESASGALLQLAQSLASPKVQAEEYNSLLDGMPALLQAIADSTDKYKGSVGRLTQDVKAGNVTGQEWSQMILRATELLEKRASLATTTFGQAMQTLQTSLVQYIGKTDESLQITDRLAGAIVLLSEHLDELMIAITIVGGVMVTKLAAGIATTTYAMVAARVQTALLSAGLAGMTTGAAATSVAMTGLRGAMAFLGGPIGIAILGVSAAIGALAWQAGKAERANSELRNTMGGAKDALDEYEKAALKAKTATGDAAAAAKQNADEMRKEALAAIAAAKALREKALAAAVAAKAEVKEWDSNPKAEGQIMAATGGMGVMAPSPSLVARTRSEKADAALKAADEGLKAANARFAAIEAGLKTGGGGATASADPKKSSGGRSAADVARASDDAIDRAKVEELNAAIANAQTLTERHALQNQLLNMEYAQKLDAIDRQVTEGEITKAAGDRLKEYAHIVQLDTIERTDRENRLEMERELAAVAGTRLSIEQEAVRDEEARLLDLAAMAETTNERINYELQALDLRMDSDRKQFEADQKVLAATLEEARVKGLITQGEIDRLLAMRSQAFDRAEGTRRQTETTAITDQANPWSKWLADQKMDAADLNAAFQAAADSGLSALNDGITDAIMGAKNLGDVFRDVSRQIIADLIRIGVQKAITQPLANAIFGGGGFMSFGVPGFANGTNSAPGGLAMVGERGPELVNLPRGSQVIPNNLLGSVGAAGRGQNFYFTNNITANDAVLTSWVEQQIVSANMATLQAARSMTRQDLSRSNKNRLF